MVKIDGKSIRDDILNRLHPPSGKFLAVIMVGDDAASVKFIEEKKKIADRLGIIFNIHSFPREIYKEELSFQIEKIAEEPSCGGVVLQLPLPPGIGVDIFSSVPSKKDVDALGENPLVCAPAVEVIKELLLRQKVSLENSAVAVLGQGFLVGKPAASWLNGKAKKLIILDKGDDLSRISEADLVVSGTGNAKLFSAKQLKAGAGVIDFGTSFVDGNLAGDFNSEEAERLSFYTPTPGGTGPILIAKLFENFCKLNA